MPGGSAGREHVVRPGQIVAERHRRVRPDEDGPRVADPAGQLDGSGGLDLQVLGRPCIRDGQRRVDIADKHARGLAGERLLDAARVPRCFQLTGQLGVDPVGKLSVGGDQQAGRERVVLGLSDQVRGDKRGVGAAVRHDRYLRRAGLAVRADNPAQQPLRRGDVDVAGAGHHVDGRAVLRAVAEHGDRLRPASRVHFGDPEQFAGREHRRVRQAAVVLLRRRRNDDLADARSLGRDHVHDYGGWIGDQSARDVDARPGDRHVAFGN